MIRTALLALLTFGCFAAAGCAGTRDTVNDLLGRDQGFGGLDKNGDGVLSRTETQDVPDLAGAFERIDTNGDNNVNRHEYRAATTMVVPTGFSSLDLNGDGVISEREANASRRSLRETFHQVDADQDGNVSSAEYQAATQNLLKKVKFEDADEDGDGVLDRSEVEKHPLVHAHFDAMDVNNDSLVGPDEFEWAQR